MKPHLTAFALFLAASLSTGCGDHHAEPDHHGEPNSHEEHSPSVLVPDALARMQLNDGQKWPMDDHTRASFVAMAEFFLDADHSSEEGIALKKAGGQLDTQLQDLIQGCTMSGAPHDQLHTFLSGYLPAVAALSHSGRLEDAKRVEHYLRSYSDFFE